MSKAAIKVSVLGAESSGKSTLIAGLLEALVGRGVVVAPEVLREVCTLKGRPPTQAEQGALLLAQQQREQSFAAHASLLLCDSAPLATALYSELLFQDKSLLQAAIEHQRGYSLTLVTWPDFGWHADPSPWMRDGPEAQQRFHTRLLECMAQAKLPYQSVRGTPEARTNLALAAILPLIR